MKLEYLYIDDSYKGKITDLASESVVLSEKKKDNLFIFCYTINGEGENEAQKLSDIHNAIFEKLDATKLFVLLDEAAEYFDKELYPLINKFERHFRKVISLIANKKSNEEAIRQAKELERLDFGQIYSVFFTDSAFLTQVKSWVNDNKNPLSKNDLIAKLKDEKENSLWKKLFGTKYSELPNSFLKIKDARNDVMHAHNISYQRYTETKDIIDKANLILRQITDDILTDKTHIKGKGLDSLTKTVTTISKLLSDGVLGTYQQQLASISKNLLTIIPDFSTTLQVPKIDYDVLNAFNAIKVPQIDYSALSALGTLQLPKVDYGQFADLGTLKMSAEEFNTSNAIDNPAIPSCKKEKKDK